MPRIPLEIERVATACSTNHAVLKVVGNTLRIVTPIISTFQSRLRHYRPPKEATDILDAMTFQRTLDPCLVTLRLIFRLPKFVSAPSARKHAHFWPFFFF